MKQLYLNFGTGSSVKDMKNISHPFTFIYHISTAWRSRGLPMLEEIEKEKKKKILKQVDPEASTQLDVPRDSPQGVPKRILI